MRALYLALSIAATALMASAVVAAAPGEAALRPPTGKWVIDYAEHQCTASRAFGTADKPLHLVIKPSPGGEVTQIALIEKGRNFQGLQKSASLATSDSRTLEVMQLSYGVGDKRFRLINLTAAQTAAVAASTSLRWTGGGADALDVGQMAGVMKILENCRSDLRRYWSIGPEHENGRISGPKTENSLISLFSSDDYPSQAWSRNQQGTTAIILLIDELGRLRDCMVEQTSGIATLDISACLIIRKRGKFSPALDSAGKPVKGAFSQRIKWVMPGN